MNLNNLILAATIGVVIQGFLIAGMAGKNGKNITKKIVGSQKSLFAPIANCSDPLSGQCDIKIPMEALSMR